MVIKSTVDYEGWKRETREYYLSKFPTKEKYIDGFMGYISSRYDVHQRVYLPKKVMWYLYSKQRWMTIRNQHYWFLCVGKKGGEGKTTLAGQILYFFDGNYDRGRIAPNFNQFIGIIRRAIKESKYPSVSLDEPETSTHSMSKKGTALRDILERIRQLNLFAGCCANSLSSVPHFIYERLSTIIAIDDEHRFWLWDNAKDEPYGTVVDDIKGRDGWGKYRHSVFKRPEFVKRSHFQNQKFSPDLPYDTKQYIASKKEDLIELIDRFIDKNKVDIDIKGRLESKRERVLKEIAKLKKSNTNITDEQIALRLGYRRETINRLRNRAVTCDGRPL